MKNWLDAICWSCNFLRNSLQLFTGKLAEKAVGITAISLKCWAINNCGILPLVY